MEHSTKKMVWTTAKVTALLREVYQRLSPDDDAAFIDTAAFATIGRMPKINETGINCGIKVSIIHSAKGYYFASINNIDIQLVPLIPEGQERQAVWNGFHPTICRTNAPNFVRNQNCDTRNPHEFVASRQGAMDALTSIGITMSTVNDDLIPCDIFGQANPDPPENGRATEGSDKAHLLPKERAEALTWNYPAVAVLGLDMAGVNSDSTQKAILGCVKRERQEDGQETQLCFPGIRNLLCNIVRMTNQQNLFDQNPCVFIFPVLDLNGVRGWQGEGYGAIVMCEAGCANQIGMGGLAVDEAKKATQRDVDTAMRTASSFCKFLGHSILQKTQAEVSNYQKSSMERKRHLDFRRDMQIPELRSPLSVADDRPIFKPILKISFVAHDGGGDPDGHPAPDPMLLEYKTCNNLCRKMLGFRMLAGAEPLELDDLSEEGQQNLRAYIQFQALTEQALRHDEIMNLELRIPSV